MYDGLKNSIKRLEEIKRAWKTFIKERLTLQLDNSWRYGQIDSGCASTIGILFIIWAVLFAVLFFVFRRNSYLAESISIIVVLSIVVLAFVGLLIVVIIVAILKLILKIFERHNNCEQ